MLCMFRVCYLYLYLFMVKTVCAYAYCTIPQWLVD